MRPRFADLGVCRACYMRDSCKEVVCNETKKFIHGYNTKSAKDYEKEERENIEKRRKQNAENISDNSCQE